MSIATKSIVTGVHEDGLFKRMEEAGKNADIHIPMGQQQKTPGWSSAEYLYTKQIG